MKTIKFVWITALVIMVFNIVIYLFHPGGETVLAWVTDLLPVICSLLAAAGLLSAVAVLKVWDRTRLSWFLIFSGIVLYMVAETTWGFLELILHYDMNAVFPSLADLFWIIGYIPVFAGLFGFISGYRKGGLTFGRWQPVLIPAMTAVLLVGIGTFFFVLVPIQQDGESGWLAKAAYTFYPLSDLLILVPSVLLLYLTSPFGKGTWSRPWRFITGGFILFTCSDILYSYLSWSSAYGAGNFTDLGWNAAYLLIGLGGFCQRDLILSLSSDKGGDTLCCWRKKSKTF